MDKVKKVVSVSLTPSSKPNNVVFKRCLLIWESVRAKQQYIAIREINRFDDDNRRTIITWNNTIRYIR
jgi:hypothetical protein